jgi:hypothetical protein
MLRFPKIVIGAGTGAALFMLGITSGYTQVGPQESTTARTETSHHLHDRFTSNFGSITLCWHGWNGNKMTPSLRSLPAP